MKKHSVVKNYSYNAAGKIWIIPKVTFSVAPDGTVVLTLAELEKIQHAIVNEICGSPNALSPDELEFLCDVSESKYVDVAAVIFANPSNLSFWRKEKKALPVLESVILKKWFWLKIFGERVNVTKMSGLTAIGDNVALLDKLRKKAISEKVVIPISQAS